MRDIVIENCFFWNWLLYT